MSFSNRVAGSSHTNKRKPGQEATHFKTDEDTGRIIIEEEDEDKTSPMVDQGVESLDKIAGSAYMEQMMSVDGFTRTATGAVKFHKDTKKRRAMDFEQDGDVEMEDVNIGAKDARRTKRREVSRLGQEFKAKVRLNNSATSLDLTLTMCSITQKAGGDVKRAGQQDPYAYVPLSKVGGGKKRNQALPFSITGKR